MEKGKYASVGRAFITGGLICVCIQVVIELLALAAPGMPLGLRGALSLVICSFICVFLTVGGVYEKIDKFGGMGAGLPLVGLVSALTGMICGARAQGASLGKAIGGALKIMLPMFVVALGSCAIFGVVLTKLGVGIFA